MRTFLLLPVPVRLGLVLAALPMFAFACGKKSAPGGTGGEGGEGGGCADACTLDATQCAGNGVQVCAVGTSGCTAWSSPTACDAGKTCVGGQCAGAGAPGGPVVGYTHACTRFNDGGVKCWGYNAYGQLGLSHSVKLGDGPNEMGDNLPLVNLGTGKTATAISSRGYHVCALLEGGSVKCWGRNDLGQLGLGDTSDRGGAPGEMGDNLPAVDLGTGKTAVAISEGYYRGCALLNGGSVKCWGSNASGALGQGDTNNRGDDPGEMGDNLPAVNLGTGKTAVAISVGWRAVCALLSGGSVKCWGFNAAGELGLGDTNHRGDNPNEMGDDLPAVNLGTGQIATAISSGWEHICALLEGGSVKCWGTNDYGELGLGNINNRGDGPGEMGNDLPAVNLGTGKTAVAISAGHGHTCALLDGGSVKCWGNNTDGQLGLGDTNHRGDGPGEMGDDLPAVNLGAGKAAVAISAGYRGTCALLNDGSVKCWGYNLNGQLGLGDTNNRGDGPGEMGDSLPSISL